MQALPTAHLLLSMEKSGSLVISHLPWPSEETARKPWPLFSVMLDADLQACTIFLQLLGRCEA